MKEYFGIHSLRTFTSLVKGELTGKLSKEDVVNNLSSTSMDKALSALQGKVLNDKINSYDQDGDGMIDAAKTLDGHPAEYFAKASDIGSQIEDEKGLPGGLAPLDEEGKIDSQYLPSYVDDVVEGYYDADAETFYEDAEKETEITGEKSKIYMDLNTNNSYRWGGSAYVMITSSDMSEISVAQINAMWNEIFEVQVDKSTLTDAIAAANTAKADVVVGTTEDEVDADTKFVTEAEMTALTNAITAAQAVADNTTASEDDVADAVTELNAAVDTFTAAIKTGTKAGE